MPTNKRQREPTPPGTKSFPFREPKEGTRWKALLNALGYEAQHSEVQTYSWLLEKRAEAILVEVRQRCMAKGQDPDDPYIASLLDSRAYFEIDVARQELEKELAQQSSARIGAPPNTPYLELIAFAVAWYEQQDAIREGRAFRLADVARKLSIHHDTLRRAYRRTAHGFIRNARAAETDPVARDLAGLLWRQVFSDVEEHWPVISARKNYRN